MPETADGPLDDLSAEQQEALIELANQQLERDGPSRRDLLTAGGVLGAGALLGGGTATAAIEPASAQAAGEVGTDDNPVDVVAESVSAESVDSEEYLQDGEPFEPGLQDGENFDGQDTSEFNNLASVSTGEQSINGYNVFVQETEPTAENVGDVWIDNSEAFE